VIGQAVSQCPKASAHCLHNLPANLTVAAGGAYPTDMICCHCGQHVTIWAGGSPPIFHGPYVPKSPGEVVFW
jgi:hypothetical protein